MIHPAPPMRPAATMYTGSAAENAASDQNAMTSTIESMNRANEIQMSLAPHAARSNAAMRALRSSGESLSSSSRFGFFFRFRSSSGSMGSKSRFSDFSAFFFLG